MMAIAYAKYGPPGVLQLTEVERPIPKDDDVQQTDRHDLRYDVVVADEVAATIGGAARDAVRRGVDLSPQVSIATERFRVAASRSMALVFLYPGACYSCSKGIEVIPSAIFAGLGHTPRGEYLMQGAASLSTTTAPGGWSIRARLVANVLLASEGKSIEHLAQTARLIPPTKGKHRSSEGTLRAWLPSLSDHDAHVVAHRIAVYGGGRAHFRGRSPSVPSPASRARIIAWARSAT
jgi:hypothetical protein